MTDDDDSGLSPTAMVLLDLGYTSRQLAEHVGPLGPQLFGATCKALESEIRTRKDAEPVLVAGLASPHLHVRERALALLRQLGFSPPLAALTLCLADPEWRVRVTALDGITDTSDASLVAPIAACARDPEEPVRRAALLAFRRLAGGSGSGVVTACLGDPSPEIVREAAEALTRAGDASAVPALVEAIMAHLALRSVGGSPVLACLDALADFDPDALLTPFLAAFGAADPLIRRAAAERVEKYHKQGMAEDPRIRTVLLDLATQDPIEFVREEARAALGSAAAHASEPQD